MHDKIGSGTSWPAWVVATYAFFCLVMPAWMLLGMGVRLWLAKREVREYVRQSEEQSGETHVEEIDETA